MIILARRYDNFFIRERAFEQHIYTYIYMIAKDKTENMEIFIFNLFYPRVCHHHTPADTICFPLPTLDMRVFEMNVM